jgi:hypothetical protein
MAAAKIKSAAAKRDSIFEFSNPIWRESKYGKGI